MFRNRILFTALLLLTLLTACTSTGEEPPAPARIVISEVQTAAQGNNNDEFIELYNAGDLPADLNGWSLMYSLHADEDDLPVYVWDSPLLIPPHGHVLLVRSGASAAEETADGVFTQALNNSFGGLALQDAEGTRVDSVGWGNAPETFIEGNAAPSLEMGVSLERLPGGELGSSQDSDDNAADFVLRDAPDPQTTGSPYTPAADRIVDVSISGPASVEPGSLFTYQLTLTNPTGQALDNLRLVFPVDTALSLTSIYQGGTMIDATAEWQIDSLPADTSLTFEVDVTAPWRYLTAAAQNIRVKAEDGALLGFAGSRWTRVEGGTLPIDIARGMLGEEVTIEGTATMYTGGFYAGSGVKFYIQDETGGVQVYVSGAGGILNVPLNALVRVRGSVLLYNNSIEIAPLSPDDVEIISIQGEPVTPLPVDISTLLENPDVYTGLLVQVEGRATRIEEFSYSYEIDLANDDGEIITLYVDELTEINIEALDLNHMYRMTGLPDWRSTALYLNPRIDADLEEIYPPEVMVQIESPGSVLPGEDATITLVVHNHLAEAVDNLIVSIASPAEGGTVTSVLDGGEARDEGLVWRLDTLAGGGASASFSYTVAASSGVEEILAAGCSVTYEGSDAPAYGPDRTVYIGEGVPIAAVQGDGIISPYKLEQINVQGVVTGVFPELGGFFIQDPIGDDNEATSDGLFIALEAEDPGVAIGDWIRASGTVRESGQQTQLALVSQADLTVLRRSQALPLAINYAPPEDDEEALLYNEALEGMLVSVAGPARAVAPTSYYGEFVLVQDEYPGERVWRGEPTGMLITVDDGSSVTHEDQSTLAYVVAVGDRVSNITGPLAFTYGVYKIEPTSPPTISAEEMLLPGFTEADENGFALMTWNVENLFDIINPHPSSPPIPTAGEYQLDLTKIANTIISAGAPAIIALQEVENIGVLEDIAEHELLAEYGYVPYLLEGDDSRGIDVGYLVRGDRVTVTLVEQRNAPGELFSRPPLLLQATVTTANGDVEIFVLNNHFLSLSAGEELTEPRRTAQAAWNGAVVEELLAENPDAAIAVVGDLNSFYATAPLAALEEAGLTHIYDLPGMERDYSYIYLGASQTLDHILISQGLAAYFVEYQTLHVNADFPPAIPDDTSPMRQSDHDPVIAWFSLSQ